MKEERKKDRREAVNMASSDTDGATSPLTEISNATELDYYLRGAVSSSSESGNSIVIVTFSTHWCGPCQRSKPQLIEMAQKYKDAHPGVGGGVSFAYVPETDMNDDFIDEYNINAFPTYICFKQGGEGGDGASVAEEVDRVEGANLQQVEAMIQKHSHS